MDGFKACTLVMLLDLENMQKIPESRVLNAIETLQNIMGTADHCTLFLLPCVMLAILAEHPCMCAAGGVRCWGSLYVMMCGMKYSPAVFIGPLRYMYAVT